MLCRAGLVIFMLVISLAAAGCVSPEPGPLPPETTVTSTPSPAPVTPVSSVSISDLALRKEDLPTDYILKDRYMVAWEETEAIYKDLGWRQGYGVSFYRLDKSRDDRTDIRQVITIYPQGSMNRVFALEKEAVTGLPGMGETIYEVPFPRIGDDSIAFRRISLSVPDSPVVYTVIFRQEDVFETITMTGTTTDYELLKEITKMASAKIP